MNALRILFACLTATSLSARADELADARQFQNLFLAEVVKDRASAPADQLRFLHFLPNARLIQSLRAPSLAQSLEAIRSTRLTALPDASGAETTAIALSPRKRPLTLILTPGMFAEFIENRAFEEVIGKRDSVERDRFHALTSASRATDHVSLLENYRPGRPEDEIAAGERRDLDQVINVSDMTIDGQVVRVVLFFAEFSTLESLGDNASRARIFSRRLEKYLQLTGPQDLAFIGYSRGTPLALEMLAQAKAFNRPWLADVKAVVSLSGVNWGSALADDAYENRGSDTQNILRRLQNLAQNLEPIDPQLGFASLENLKAIAGNALKWSAFNLQSVQNLLGILASRSPRRSLANLTALLETNPTSALGIAGRVWTRLGLNHPLREYDQSLERFSYFVDRLLTSIKELTTNDRVAWWEAHDVPLAPTYYALTAAMANPEDGGLERWLFQNPMSYGGADNFDDETLLQSRLDYERNTKNSAGHGISLNDGQVSIAQAAFLPAVIGALRPSNAGLKTKFLGALGTHHWGVALRVVNEKDFSFGDNGFPREALLRALAKQIWMDNL